MFAFTLSPTAYLFIVVVVFASHLNGAVGPRFRSTSGALTSSSAYEKWHARNALAAHSDEWPPLKIVLLKTSQLPDLPATILQSLTSAIHNLGMLVNVRRVNKNEREIPELANLGGILRNCTKDPKFISESEPLIAEGFIPIRQTLNAAAGDQLVGDALLELGNFFLILQANQEICKDDKFLLAAAAPCPLSKKAENDDRPLIGRLIICQKSPAWRTFKSAFDLFRHEILHALGFGLLMPREDDQSVDAKYYKWRLFGGERSIPYQAHFMDFAKRATEYGKKYFNCPEIDGIEAEDEHKIHLSEYIFGNELMTPAVNNGPNYFTYFTAQILEETFHGTKPWYSTNKQLVERESRSYWWARGAGCRFLNASCFDLIDQHERNFNRDVNWISAFCTEKDLVLELESREPKQLCFWNGSAVARFSVHCKTSRHLQIRPLYYEPIALQSQFPALAVSHGGFRNHPLYGSDYDHRYCPLTIEMLDGSLDDVPMDAKLVDCANIMDKVSTV